MINLPVIAGYVEDDLDLSGNDNTVLIPVGSATKIGIDIKGPTGTPTHVGTLVFDQMIDSADTPKQLPVPTVSFTAGNPVDVHIDILDFTAPYLRIRYIFGSDGAAETCNVKVRAKRPWGR